MQAAERRLPRSYRQELFLNAWNEWAEKAVLEPDMIYGDLNLQVLKRQLRPAAPKSREA